MILYPHQEKFISDIRHSMKGNKAVLAVAPTGMGKTVVAAFMVKAALARGTSVMFMVHRRELLEQTSATFTENGIEHGFVAAGRPLNPYHRCHIVLVGSLAGRKGRLTPPGLFIVDEAHHSGAQSWSDAVDWARDGGAWVIGLTATPWRSDRRGFKQWFSDMVQGPSVSWLIEQGFLSRYRAFSPSEPDLGTARMTAGDFSTTDLDRIMNDGVLYGDAVRNWRKYADGKKTIVFCPTVNVSQSMAKQFKWDGISAAHLDADTDKDERRRVIQDFADGRIDVVTNVNLFSEGFDLSSMAGRDVPIEAVILYRPTMSLAMYRQQVGRALRRKSEPAVILDHASNIRRHGLPCDDIEWTLDDRGKKKRGENVPLVKTCPECYASYALSSGACPECGYTAVIERKEAEFLDGELVEMTAEAMEEMKAKKSREVAEAKTIDDLRAIAVSRGYAPGWVFHVAKAKKIYA